MTTNIKINKTGESPTKSQDIAGIQIDTSKLKSEYLRKFNTDISELKSIRPIPLDREETAQTTEEAISLFFSDYETISKLMTEQEITNHFNRVKLDVPDNILIESISDPEESVLLSLNVKKKALLIGDTGGVLVTNNYYAQNGYQFPLFYSKDLLESHRPFTITTQIKPNTRPQKSKYIFRHFARLKKLDYEFIDGKWEELRDSFTIGISVYLMKTGKIHISYGYLNNNIETVTHNTLDPKVIFLTSKDKIEIGEWNHVSFGITENGFLFIKINKKEKTIFTETQLTNTTIDLKIFLHRMMVENGKTIYDEVTTETVIELFESPEEDDQFGGQQSQQDESITFNGLQLLATFSAENIYFEFPQFIIGGIDNNSDFTYIGRLRNEPVPNWLRKFTKSWIIRNGLSDFYIASLRYYDKELTEDDIKNDSITNTLNKDFEQLASQCTLDLQFEKTMNNNKIRDFSTMGNHGQIIGDMNFIISGENNDVATLVKEILPEIKDIEGPF